MLHGREFIVSRALDRYSVTDRLKDPTDVRYEMPWTTERIIKQGDDAGKVGIYIPTRQGMERMAVVERSAYGVKDEIGRFSKQKTTDQLMDSNLFVPPLHCRCRSVIVPVV